MLETCVLGIAVAAVLNQVHSLCADFKKIVMTSKSIQVSFFC